MKFSILVPAFNEEQSITSCLDSLTKIVYENKEIIVIDDASNDHTIQIVEKYLDKGVILVRREKNGGRAAALNSGLQKTTGDIVITTDADTIVPSDWLQRFKKHLEQAEVVAVGGSYRAKNKDKLLANVTSVLDEIFNNIFRKSVVPNKLSGVNSAMRRKELIALGGFNESSWWSEDSELGWKLSETGRIVYDPDNIVATDYPDTWRGIWKRKFYWGYAMGLKFRERIPFNIKLLLRPFIFISLFLSFFACLLTIPFGTKVFLIPFVIFFFLLSSLTIVYIPLGLVVMLKNAARVSMKTLIVLGILPFIREFAYVYGMCLGFFKGGASKIRPSWKDKNQEIDINENVNINIKEAQGISNYKH